MIITARRKPCRLMSTSQANTYGIVMMSYSSTTMLRLVKIVVRIIGLLGSSTKRLYHGGPYVRISSHIFFCFSSSSPKDGGEHIRVFLLAAPRGEPGGEPAPSVSCSLSTKPTRMGIAIGQKSGNEGATKPSVLLSAPWFIAGLSGLGTPQLRQNLASFMQTLPHEHTWSAVFFLPGWRSVSALLLLPLVVGSPSSDCVGSGWRMMSSA
mmetsp:Transcript_60713/g.159641  ORF Transcript_60713/g.159641 Transcript_60713/m.159641 type:complete len:209 (-) Transcript_60713:512-1138(-)